jgi:hypothetical protein
MESVSAKLITGMYYCLIQDLSEDQLFPVSSLKVLVRKHGGARHTGIEIQEFIVEN